MSAMSPQKLKLDSSLKMHQIDAFKYQNIPDFSSSGGYTLGCPLEGVVESSSLFPLSGRNLGVGVPAVDDDRPPAG